MPSGAVKRQKGRRSGSWRWLVPLCVVLMLVLAVIFLFRFRNVHLTATDSATTSNTNTGAANQPVPSLLANWNSAVAMVGMPGVSPVLSIKNYDLVSGKQKELVLQPLGLPLDTQIDGISRDGKNLLYQFSSGGRTLYYTLSSIANTGYFYALDGSNAGNALWFPDGHAALILSLGSQVTKVDIHTGQAQTVVPLPVTMTDGQQAQIGKLVFYLNGYLYFMGAEGACQDTLCRVSLDAKDPLGQRVSFQATGATYWLSPDGSTIFFANSNGPVGEPGIYAVGVDGSSLRLLRQQYKNARIVGFGFDHSLELVVDQDGSFNLLKLGETSQEDTIVRKDIAPGTTNLCAPATVSVTRSTCDSNLALAPSGQTLLVAGVMPDGSTRVWINDLVHGKQSLLFSTNVGTQVQLAGWDALSVN